jgi:hypothetical protein
MKTLEKITGLSKDNWKKCITGLGTTFLKTTLLVGGLIFVVGITSKDAPDIFTILRISLLVGIGMSCIAMVAAGGGNLINYGSIWIKQNQNEGGKKC